MSELDDISSSNEDIMTMLSNDFSTKWAEARVDSPVIFINFEQLWSRAKVEVPELLGTWKDVKIDVEPLRELVGDLAEPLVDFIALSRKSSILQHINLFVNLGYIEMIFDIDNFRETYRLTGKTENPELVEQFKELINVYEQV